MGRKRWIYVNGEAFEVGSDFVPESRTAHISDGILWNDRHYADTRGPEGQDLSTRTKHREFMRSSGLTTIDDYQSSWTAAEKKRTEYVTQGKHGAVNREHVARAIHELEGKRR